MNITLQLPKLARDCAYEDFGAVLRNRDNTSAAPCTQHPPPERKRQDRQQRHGCVVEVLVVDGVLDGQAEQHRDERNPADGRPAHLQGSERPEKIMSPKEKNQSTNLRRLFG